MKGRALKRVAAPAAFLLAATIAVMLVRAGLRGGESTTTAPTTTAPITTVVKTSPTQTRPRGRRFYRLRAGDTLGSVALKFDTSVERLLELNPGVDPTSLRVGQRVRVA